MKVIVEVGEGSMVDRQELEVGELYEFGDPYYHFKVVEVVPRLFTLYDGTVIDLDDVPEGHGVCFVCGIVPQDPQGRGCTHDGRDRG